MTILMLPDNIFITGSITRGLLRLAGPAMLSVLLQTLFSIADMYWVGRLGPHALAALSAATFAYWLLIAIGQMVTIGTSAMVARRVGSRELADARAIATQGIYLAVLVSLVCAVAGLSTCGALLRFMQLTELSAGAGAAYLRAIFGGVTFIFLSFALEAVYRGNGDTKTPMRVLFVTLLLNIGLDPLLILGIGPFPAWGTAGAGVATVVSHAIGVTINVIILRHRGWLAPQRRIDGQVWRTLLRIGVPISTASIIFCGIYMVITRLIAPHYGDAAVASLGIGHKGEALSYLASVGFATAAATMVGQNLGAEKSRRAEKAAWKSVGMLSLITGTLGILMFTCGRLLAGFFTQDPEVLAGSESYLRIVALSQIFMGLEIVFEGAFGGAGRTVPPMVVSISVTILRIPVIYLCTRLGAPVEGVWWTISLTQVVRGMWIALWFRAGVWKTSAV
ncbi:MAG: MATE family efflux transporter [Planctomycetota bacterium]